MRDEQNNPQPGLAHSCHIGLKLWLSLAHDLTDRQGPLSPKGGVKTYDPMARRNLEVLGHLNSGTETPDRFMQ